MILVLLRTLKTLYSLKEFQKKYVMLEWATEIERITFAEPLNANTTSHV